MYCKIYPLFYTKHNKQLQLYIILCIHYYIQYTICIAKDTLSKHYHLYCAIYSIKYIIYCRGYNNNLCHLCDILCLLHSDNTQHRPSSHNCFQTITSPRFAGLHYYSLAISIWWHSPVCILSIKLVKKIVCGISHPNVATWEIVWQKSKHISWDFPP